MAFDYSLGRAPTATRSSREPVRCPCTSGPWLNWANYPRRGCPTRPAPDLADSSAGPLHPLYGCRLTEGKAKQPTLGERLFGGPKADSTRKVPAHRPPGSGGLRSRRDGPPRRPRLSSGGRWSRVARAWWPVPATSPWPGPWCDEPVAGEIIENATIGTLVDRLMQPVVRNGEKWQDLFDLLGSGPPSVWPRPTRPSRGGAAFARKRLVNLPRIAANIQSSGRRRRCRGALIEVMPDLAECSPTPAPTPIPSTS